MSRTQDLGSAGINLRVAAWAQAVAVGASLATSGAVGLVFTAGGTEGRAALAAMGILVALALAPLQSLPRLAILLTLLVPTDYLPLPRLLQGFPLGILPFGVFLLRSRWKPQRRLMACLAFLFCLAVIASEEGSRYSSNRGLLTGAAAAIMLGGVWLTQPTDFLTDESRHGFRDFFVSTIAWVALYAIVETFVLKSNPIYGSLYARSNDAVSQVWSQYRATSTLGHPLLNATFFAPAAVLAFGAIIERPRWPAVGRFLLILGAVDATRSRSALIATALGILVLMVLQRGHQGVGFRKITAMVVVAGVAVALAPSYLARANSLEAQQSASERGTVIPQTKYDLGLVGVTGAGLGEAEVLQNELGIATTSPGLENGYAEAAVGLGVPGFAVFILLILAIAVVGLRKQASIVEAAGFVALLIAMSGWKSVDGHAEVFVLLGLFSAGIIAAQGRGAPEGLEQIDIAVDA